MSQERTEQRDCYFCHGSGKKIVVGEPDIVNAVDCPVCKGSEIDRLNAVITDLTAKVQERDKLVNEHAANSYAASEACQSMAEEIEWLRSAVSRLGCALDEIASRDITVEQAVEIAELAIENDRTALKGAE